MSTQMDPEVKELWATALESGEFKQGHFQLRQTEYDDNYNVVGHSYCCLGVLCELYRRQTTEGHWNEDGRFVGPTDSDPLTLPHDVMSWAGIKQPNPEITIDGKTTVAAVFNDGNDAISMHTFAEIARGIRESL